MADLSRGMKIIACPSCGKENAEGTCFCPVCGEFIEEIKPTTPHAEEVFAKQPDDPTLQAPEKSDSENGITCCNMLVPDGEEYCALCGGAVKQYYEIQWPWGDSSLVKDRLFIGRVPPVDEKLARKLEDDYLNISRIHAELFTENGKLMLRDLGSSNGTFIGNQRIQSFQTELVNSKSCIRFASDFEITIKKA